MPLTPAELELVARLMGLLANFEDAPPERLVRRAVLALRDKELQDRERPSWPTWPTCIPA